MTLLFRTYTVIASRKAAWRSSVRSVVIAVRIGHREASRRLYYDQPEERTLYTGVTSDLVRRVSQHRQGSIDGFARRYGCRFLVYFEMYDEMIMAIAREKQIKAGSRGDKLELIESVNPGRDNLYQLVV